MIHKTTNEKINELRETIKSLVAFKQELLNDNNSRDATLTDIHISTLKEKLESSYTESTPLWDVQDLTEKKIDKIHDKALAIQRELCRIYKKQEMISECESCPLYYCNDGNEDKCFDALKQHLVCQYLTTQFYV